MFLFVIIKTMGIVVRCNSYGNCGKMQQLWELW